MQPTIINQILANPSSYKKGHDVAWLSGHHHARLKIVNYVWTNWCKVQFGCNIQISINKKYKGLQENLSWRVHIIFKKKFQDERLKYKPIFYNLFYNMWVINNDVLLVSNRLTRAVFWLSIILVAQLFSRCLP